MERIHGSSLAHLPCGCGGARQAYRDTLSVVVTMLFLTKALDFLGGIVMEIWATRVMRFLNTGLFHHLVNQDIDFFLRAATSEIIVRSSQDSMTLRSIYTSTFLQLLTSLATIVGVLIAMSESNDADIIYRAGFWAPLIINLAALFIFSLFYAAWARRANLHVRQAMGRLMGFTYESCVPSQLRFEPVLHCCTARMLEADLCTHRP